MKLIKKQRQVVAIYATSYKVVYTDADRDKVNLYARLHRERLKEEGATSVIVNTGFYECEAEPYTVNSVIQFLDN